MFDRLRRWAQLRRRGRAFNLDCEEHMQEAMTAPTNASAEAAADELRRLAGEVERGFERLFRRNLDADDVKTLRDAADTIEALRRACEEAAQELDWWLANHGCIGPACTDCKATKKTLANLRRVTGAGS